MDDHTPAAQAPPTAELFGAARAPLAGVVLMQPSGALCESTAQMETLRGRFTDVRARSREIASRFSVEDQLLQAMPEASPIKWHLAHTTWFFETFVLRQVPGYRSLDERFEALFNSYYNAIGPQPKRAERGLWSRPSAQEVLGYRSYVDEALVSVLGQLPPELYGRVELGLHHEQQHQELMLTDVLAGLARNPLQSAALSRPSSPDGAPAQPLTFAELGGGIFELGHTGGEFCFDNEGPQHQVIVQRFELAERPITNEEVIAFVEAGGYERPELWLSDGFDWVRHNALTLPCYWSRDNDGFSQFSLYGLQSVEPGATACHLSYFEADAIARFLGGRLPTEAEWELAARAQPPSAVEQAHYSDDERWTTRPVVGAGLRQLFGTVWEWTCSAYAPYPGFAPTSGALGEYNGKFMHGQLVLRGGSLGSPRGHVRPTYRNFFPGSARWQFSGARVARDVSPRTSGKLVFRAAE